MTGQKNSVLKVITVDDSLIIAERLREILAELEQVEFIGNATSVSSAIALIAQQTPDVVILDINLEHGMPTSNGISLLIFIREKFIDMKIIMLTNLTHPQYRDTCLLLGADYFLDKTNDFENIPKLIKSFCSEAKD